MISRVAFTTLFAVFSILFVGAQIEEVSIGAGYSQQAYYNLESGAVEVVRNDAWDIAFSNAGFQDAGVFLNESAELGGTPLQLFVASTTDWSEEISDLSQFVDSTRLYNAELNWTDGAFNSIKDPMSPFDFGWGAYNPQTMTVVGDKIYVIQLRNGDFIKFQVMDLISGVYRFRYADLDGSNEVESSVSKTEAGDSPLIYYSFRDEDTYDISPDYHLLFTRYATPLDPGDGSSLQYNVTGVLLAPGVEAVVADGVDLENVNEADYANDYTSEVGVIGHDWKTFAGQQGWLIDQDRTHFVKLPNGDKYQITFFDFEGSMTGITTLEKSRVGVTSTDDEFSLDQEISIFPNPTTDYIQIKSESQESMRFELYSLNGQQLMNTMVSPNEPIILPESVATGTYFARINGASSAKKVFVNR
jgi:hypothetical protein